MLPYPELPLSRFIVDEDKGYICLILPDMGGNEGRFLVNYKNFEEMLTNRISNVKGYLNFFKFDGESETELTQGEWEKLIFDSTVGFQRNGISFNVGTGVVSKVSGVSSVYKVEAIVSASSTNNQEIHFAFFKNGALWPCSEQSMVTGGSGRADNISFHCLVSLREGDTLEVYVKNSTSNADVTVRNINVIITEL